MYYQVHIIDKNKLGKELTPEMLDVITKVFNNLQDVNGSLAEVQDIDLSQIRELNNSMWSLHHTFKFKAKKE